MKSTCMFVVYRNINKQTRLVWGVHGTYQNASDASIHRIERICNRKETIRYTVDGNNIIQNAYYPA